MPTKGKPKNAANQHDKRHESGLALPGKRVARQRSNGHLNGGSSSSSASNHNSNTNNGHGQPNGSGGGSGSHASSASNPPPQTSTGLTSALGLPRPLEGACAVETSRRSASVGDHDGQLEQQNREGIASDAYSFDHEPHDDMAERNAPGDLNAAYATSNVEGARSAYPQSRSSYSGVTASAFSTILTSYPLRDAISILILLLSLPPTLVLIIQTLFASLTFVPPSAGLTLPNIREMFGSSGMGYPALATIVIVDLLFWICWLPMWTPLQNMFVDLSHAVIAISLSGAAASNGRTTYSIATTSIIVCAVHVLRYKAIHLTALDYLRSVINRASIGGPINVSSSFAAQYSSTSVDRVGFYATARALLGIHIVSQGVTTYVRRSLVKANEQQNANLPPNIRTDVDALPGDAETTSRSNTLSGEPPQTPSIVLIPDGRSAGSSPSAHRDSRPRETTGRRRRKQANQARSQQPLWAAVASTKVTFIKEMEQRHAADDAREAAGTDASNDVAAALGNPPAMDRIWIRDVRDTEILFTVELSSDTAQGRLDRDKNGAASSTSIDRSKPFYVCINGATWSSTRIAPSLVTQQSSDSNVVDRFDGEIFGLAPLSSYYCEVVCSTGSKRVVCEASVITQAAPSAEQAAVASSQPAPTLRPSSPISTLKQSIQAAEAKLQETRNRGKKSRRDQRGAHSDIKREINVLRSKLESSGGSDDKQERRLNQITQHKNQAEEAAAEIKEQIEALGETPQHEIDESEVQRRQWKSVLHTKTHAQHGYDEAKAEADRELSSLRYDIDQAASRREKLLARHAQRTQDMEKLVSKQHADMTAKQRRDYERAQIIASRESEEQQLRFHIMSFDTESQNYQQKAHDAYQQIAALQSWPSQAHHQQQPPPYPGYSSPPTPETQAAGLNGAAVSVSGGGSSSSGMAPFPAFSNHAFAASPFKVPVFPIAHAPAAAPRARSSSMLSQYSGFTDNGDEGPSAAETAAAARQQSWPVAQPITFAGAPAAVPDGHRTSEGSGSASLTGGSTGSNSPRPEANPFVPTKGALSTVQPVGAQNRNGKEKDKDKMRQSPLQASATVGSVDDDR